MSKRSNSSSSTDYGLPDSSNLSSELSCVDVRLCQRSDSCSSNLPHSSMLQSILRSFAVHALLESTRTNDSAVNPDLLDTILAGAVAYSSPPPGVPHSPWQYNKVETSVYQKVKVLLEFREIDVALRNVVQAQGLRKIGRQIIQLFLDSHDRTKMSEDVRKYVQASTSRRSSRSRRKPHRQTNALTIILIKTAGFWISQRPNFSIFRR